MPSDSLRVVDGVGTTRIAMAAVIAGLLQGMSVGAAADAAGVTKSTVLSWHKSNTEFQAMLAESEDEIARQIIGESAAAAVERLQSLGAKAVDVLEEALDSADEKVAIAAANSVLRYTPKPTSGPTTPIEGLVRGATARPAAGD